MWWSKVGIGYLVVHGMEMVPSGPGFTTNMNRGMRRKQEGGGRRARRSKRRRRMRRRLNLTVFQKFTVMT